jgi:hypothetical protein
VSSESPRFGEVDPSHVGPPDLVLQEIIALSEVPEDFRKRVADSLQTLAEKGNRWHGSTWADVTFAGRALALVEGTDQPDYDDYEDPLIWVFGLSAESPVLGEAIVSAGGFATSSTEIRFSKNEPTLRGRRLSFFSVIRTEPRSA